MHEKSKPCWEVMEYHLPRDPVTASGMPRLDLAVIKLKPAHPDFRIPKPPFTVPESRLRPSTNVIIAGFGEVFDPDVDADGIPNVDDRCPLSPLSARPVEMSGERMGCAQGENPALPETNPRTGAQLGEGPLRFGPNLIAGYAMVRGQSYIQLESDIVATRSANRVINGRGDSGGPLFTEHFTRLIGVSSEAGIKEESEDGKVSRIVRIGSYTDLTGQEASSLLTPFLETR